MDYGSLYKVKKFNFRLEFLFLFVVLSELRSLPPTRNRPIVRRFRVSFHWVNTKNLEHEMVSSIINLSDKDVDMSSQDRFGGCGWFCERSSRKGASRITGLVMSPLQSTILDNERSKKIEESKI